MSFVAVPARSAGRYAQLIHIYLWTTCGIPHDFPQNVDKRENLWITFSVQRPYDNRKSRGFQGLFGADFFGKNACYPQTDCFSGQGYPQYPVVCGKARHKFSRGHAGFPSFSRQKVWNCAQRFSGKNFVGRGMHREKGELWRNGPSARSEEGVRGTGACRAQWAKQAGGASEIARSDACIATMRVSRTHVPQAGFYGRGP